MYGLRHLTHSQLSHPKSFKCRMHAVTSRPVGSWTHCFARDTHADNTDNARDCVEGSRHVWPRGTSTRAVGPWPRRTMGAGYARSKPTQRSERLIGNLRLRLHRNHWGCGCWDPVHCAITGADFPAPSDPSIKVSWLRPFLPPTHTLHSLTMDASSLFNVKDKVCTLLLLG